MKKHIIILKINVILLLVILFSNLSYADSISQSTKHLTIKLETTDQNIIIVNSQNKNYIKLINNQQITITCTKDVKLGNGSLTAYVNTKIAQPSYCLKYIENSDQNDDNNCLQEEFTFNLESDRSNYFEVWCKFVSLSHNEISSLFLQRLYDDSIPRIRNGLLLTSANATVTHFINLEKISCEAIRKDSDNTFDSIDWFLIDTQQSLSSDRYQLNKINNSILNYTSIFPATSGLVKNNSYYRCCTLLNNKIKNCQQFLAVKQANPSGNLGLDLATTRKVLHLSKKVQKQPLAAMNSSNKNIGNIAKAANLVSSTTSFRILKETGEENEANMENSVRTATVCCDTIGTSAGTSGGSSSLGSAEVGIIIACIGGAVILILICILAFLCYKRRRYGSVYTQKRCISGSDKSSVIRISQDHLNQSHHEHTLNHYDHYHHHHHCDHHCHHHPDHHLHHHNHHHHQHQQHYHHAHHPDEICNNSTIQSHTASFRNLDQSYERVLNESRIRELNEMHSKDYISIIPVTHETTKYYSSTTKTTHPNDDDSKLYQKVKKQPSKKKSSFFKRSNKKSLNITQIDVTAPQNQQKSSNKTETTSLNKHSNSIRSNHTTTIINDNLDRLTETLPPPPPPPPPSMSQNIASSTNNTIHVPITNTASTSYVRESKKSNFSDNNVSESSILYAAQPKRTSITNNANKDISMINEMIETYEEEVEHEEKINHNNVLY